MDSLKALFVGLLSCFGCNNETKQLRAHRSLEYPVESLIADRWSARSFSDVAVTQKELMTLLTAASLAPSSYNSQPWRFGYASKGTPEFAQYVDLLVPFNQSWAKEASFLVLVLSRKTMEVYGQTVPSRTHSFDTGAAAENMALQGVKMGIVVHGMEGFDYDRAHAELNIPEDFAVEAMFAVGKLGDKTRLPEMLRDKEMPSPRRAISELIFEGSFSAGK
jgi:nitroreductase